MHFISENNIADEPTDNEYLERAASVSTSVSTPISTSKYNLNNTTEKYDSYFNDNSQVVYNEYGFHIRTPDGADVLINDETNDRYTSRPYYNTPSYNRKPNTIPNSAAEYFIKNEERLSAVTNRLSTIEKRLDIIILKINTLMGHHEKMIDFLYAQMYSPVGNETEPTSERIVEKQA